MASENTTRSFEDRQEAGGAVIAHNAPPNWQSIGCVTARLLKEKTRERLAPCAGHATHNGETIMGSQEYITGKEGAQ